MTAIGQIDPCTADAFPLHLRVAGTVSIVGVSDARADCQAGMTPKGSDTMDTEAELDARHREKMKKIKAARDALMATKTEEKGLIMVHTGAGKGKSSAGFGMILRSIAWGLPCAVVQFIKGTWETGEKKLLRDRFAEECTFVVSGEGFTWDVQDRQRDIAAAKAGWERAKELIRDPEMHLVLLDEINIALRYDYLDIDDVVEFLLTEKPAMTHVCLTGRNAKPELIEAADLVTEMTLVKHPFRDGIKAQRGVEF